jgi:hypothetical protein
MNGCGADQSLEASIAAHTAATADVLVEVTLTPALTSRLTCQGADIGTAMFEVWTQQTKQNVKIANYSDIVGAAFHHAAYVPKWKANMRMKSTLYIKNSGCCMLLVVRHAEENHL